VSLQADSFLWLALHRVHRGGVARKGEQLCYRGRPMPPGLLGELYEYLLEDGALVLGAPDGSGMQRVRLTEAGLARYQVLDQRQRRLGLVVVLPAPDHGPPAVLTPAGRRSSPAPLEVSGGRPDPAA